MDLRNWEFYIDNGNPVVGASVYVRDAILTHPNTTTIIASTTTDPNGMWSITGLTPTPKDIQVVWGNVSQYQKWYKGMTQHNVDVVFFGNSDVQRHWKNRLINGNFPLLQRNVLTTTDNAYGFDRWRLLLEAANAATLAQETSDTPPGGSHYAAKLIIGSANNNKAGLFQPIEGADMWDMRNGVGSVSFWMKVSDPRIGDVRAAIVNWTGTENATTADPISVWGAATVVPTYTGSWANANTPVNLNPTTSWVQYRIENVPISASATNLALFVWIDDKTTTAADYLLITDIQLERGAYATPFERRPIQMELALSQRHGEGTPIVTGAGASIGIGQAISSTAVNVEWVFKVRKRKAITTLTGTGSFSASTAGGIANLSASYGSFQINGLDSIAVQFTTGGSLVSGNASHVEIGSVGTSYLFAEAEL